MKYSSGLSFETQNSKSLCVETWKSTKHFLTHFLGNTNTLQLSVLTKDFLLFFQNEKNSVKMLQISRRIIIISDISKVCIFEADVTMSKLRNFTFTNFSTKNSVKSLSSQLNHTGHWFDEIFFKRVNSCLFHIVDVWQDL